MRPPPPFEHQFRPGQSGNPGGQPRGKRISTWMDELGDLPPEKWPNPKKLPTKGRIAMARLRKSMEEDGIRDTELVLDRTEGAVVAEPSSPILERIAAAILALKAAGVEIRKPIEAEFSHAEESNFGSVVEDEKMQTKRFLRDRK